MNQKPDAAGLQKVIQPIAEQLGAATSLTEGRRNSAFNHNKTVADALQALTWILYSGPNCGLNLPAQHIMESWQSAEFFANKVNPSCSTKTLAEDNPASHADQVLGIPLFGVLVSITLGLNWTLLDIC